MIYETEIRLAEKEVARLDKEIKTQEVLFRLVRLTNAKNANMMGCDSIIRNLSDRRDILIEALSHFEPRKKLRRKKRGGK